MELMNEHLFSEVGDSTLVAEMERVYGAWNASAAGAPVWIGGHYPKALCEQLEFYAWQNSHPYRIYRDFIEHDVDHDGRVLDIGSAGGPQTKLLARYFREVVGVESAPDRVAFAVKYNGADNIKYVEGRFPCAGISGKFDYIFCVSVLYQNNQSIGKLAESSIVMSAMGMLEPGGKLFVYNPDTDKATVDCWGLNSSIWTASHGDMKFNDRIVVSKAEA